MVSGEAGPRDRAALRVKRPCPRLGRSREFRHLQHTQSLGLLEGVACFLDDLVGQILVGVMALCVDRGIETLLASLIDDLSCGPRSLGKAFGQQLQQAAQPVQPLQVLVIAQPGVA